MVRKEHLSRAPREASFAVVTVSTSRYEKKRIGERITDKSGDAVAELLTRAGLSLCGRELVPDDSTKIRAAVLRLIYESGADIVVIVGGTGIAPSDKTVETLNEIFDKEIAGFRHLFFILSHQEMGTGVLTTRVTAGVIGKAAVFLLPGSLHAVILAVTKLIIPQWRHILHHIREGAS